MSEKSLSKQMLDWRDRSFGINPPIIRWIEKSKKLEARLIKHSDAVAGAQVFAINLKAEKEKLANMLKTLIGNIDTLFNAYPEKMPFEDAMRHWQRCAREVLEEKEERPNEIDLLMMNMMDELSEGQEDE